MIPYLTRTWSGRDRRTRCRSCRFGERRRPLPGRRLQELAMPKRRRENRDERLVLADSPGEPAATAPYEARHRLRVEDTDSHEARSVEQLRDVFRLPAVEKGDRKSTPSELQSLAYLVCRL